METEYYQEIWNIKKNPPPQKKAFQNIVAIFKINSFDFRLVLYVGFRETGNAHNKKFLDRPSLLNTEVFNYVSVRFTFSPRIFSRKVLGIDWTAYNYFSRNDKEAKLV